jgi:hypothetical protein
VSCSQDVDVLADAVGRELGFYFGGDPASGAAGGSMLAEPPWASGVVLLGAGGAGGGVTASTLFTPSTLGAGASTADLSTVGSAGVTTREVVSALVGAFARCRG